MTEQERRSWSETTRRCEAIAMKASGAACKIFLALKSFSDVDGYAWPLISTLSDSTQIKRRVTIFRALNELEARGIVFRAPLSSRIRGRNSPTLYRLGRKVETLPNNAKPLYVLGPIKKQRSAVPEMGRGSKKRNLAIEMGEVSTTVTGVVSRSATAEVSKSATTPVAETATQKYSSELLQGTTPKEGAVPGHAYHHRHPCLNTPTGKTNDDDGAGVREPALINSAELRIQRLKDLAFEIIKTEANGHFSEREISDFFDVVQSRASSPPISANFFVTAFRSEVGGRLEPLPPSPAANPAPPVRSPENTEIEWTLDQVDELLDYADPQPYSESPESWLRRSKRLHRKAVHFVNGTVEFKDPEKRREFTDRLRRISRKKAKYEAERERRREQTRARYRKKESAEGRIADVEKLPSFTGEQKLLVLRRGTDDPELAESWSARSGIPAHIFLIKNDYEREAEYRKFRDAKKAREATNGDGGTGTEGSSPL